MNKKILFDETAVVKYCSNAELEAKNTLCAYELAKSSELFIVPKVIHYDDKHLKLEKIPGIKPLHYFLSDKKKSETIIIQTATALSFIHKNFQPSIKKPLQLFDEAGCDCFLHGDFNVVNVQYDGKNLVILDWSLTPLMNSSANFGSIYWDIGWFLVALVYMPPYHLFRSEYRKKLILVFLENYFKSSSFTYEEKMFKKKFNYQIDLLEKNYWNRLKWHNLKQWYYYIGEWKFRSKFDIFPFEFLT